MNIFTNSKAERTVLSKKRKLCAHHFPNSRSL